jgi:hypothetical protein
MSWKHTSLGLGFALIGVVAGPGGLDLLSTSANAGEGSKGGDLLCRTFSHNVNDAVVVDTSDRTSDVGQWVDSERAKGWVVASVDFELAQKPNGYPQGFVQVCLSGSR